MARRWRRVHTSPNVRKCPQMTGNGAKLRHKQEAAIVALLSHRSIEEAARAVPTSAKTLLRWLKEPEFDAAYREARRLAYGQSIARLQQAASAATSTLLKIMVDTSSPPSCRLRAADSVLSHAAKAIEIEEIDARLSTLERAAEPNRSGGNSRWGRKV